MSVTNPHWMARVVMILGLWGGCTPDSAPVEIPGEPVHRDSAARIRSREPRKTPMTPDLRVAFIAARQKEAGPEYAYAPAGTLTESKLRAENRGQGFAAELTAAGASVIRPQGAITMRLAAWGCPGALTKVSSRPPRLSGKESDSIRRAEYRAGASENQITEWYQNGPLGLEQGFEIPARPACLHASGGNLRLEVAIAGAESLRLTTSQFTEDPRIEITVGKGAEKLVYSDLFAQDADGKLLPVEMNLEDDYIVLTVDTRSARYPLTVDPLVWMQQALLTASDAATSDGFGRSVSLAGDTVVVGAPSNDHAGGTNAGAAYVFVRSGATWTQQAKLTASDAAADDSFGVSVALSGDTVVVGASSNDHTGGINAGAAYVFVRSGTTWTQQAKLTASDAAAGDSFGKWVSLSGDTALIAAEENSHSGAALAGAAYVFVRSGTTWTQQAKLIASDPGTRNFFGSALSLYGDTAVVTAPYNNHSFLSSPGAAYVFVRSGTTWTQQAKLIASDAESFAVFGSAVGLFGDTVVVGDADDNYTGGGIRVGSAYVFVRSGTTWTQQAKLTASDPGTDENFGYSVSIVGDMVLIGAPFDLSSGGTAVGAAYVFVRSGATWTQRTKLTASDAATSDRFGFSVALSTDTAVIGGPFSGGAIDSGAIYVFRGFKNNGDSCISDSECLSNTCALGTCGKANGTTCVMSSECRNNYCVDGVCCNTACAGGTSDCQACSVAAGASVDGTCGPRAAGPVCASADSSRCIAGGVCNGTSIYCDLIPSADTVICNFSADNATCRANYRCNGTSAGICPTNNPTPASNSIICNASGNSSLCIANYRCNGTTVGSCPTTNPTPASNSVICNSTANNSQCRANYRCDGTTVGSCPTTNPTPASSSVVCNSTANNSQCRANYRCDGTTVGSCPTTNPTPASNSVVCNSTANNSQCQANYRCDGTTIGSCPTTNPTPASAGTVCAGANASLCIAGGTCNGSTTVCNLIPAANSVVCDSTPDNTTCRANYRCNGITAGSCPLTHPTPASSSVMCRAVASECDAADYCNGSSATSCPADQPQTDNTSCSVGSCQTGQCRAEANLSVSR